jgi:tRNA modification GTPase
VHLADGHRGEILREGFRVVIAGPANVGKSSLLNALARREAAIVSAEAGTTRDVIEVRLDIEGLPIILSDTAGIRAAGGEIEREGIRRTIARGREADLILWVMDARAPEWELPADLAGRQGQTLWVANKIDLISPLPLPLQAGGEGQGEGQHLAPTSCLPRPLTPALTPREGRGERETVAISALTEQGLDMLSCGLAAIARERIGTGESAALTQARHRQALEDCAASLGSFLSGNAVEVELRAEDLRQAVRALGRLTGRVDAELVLDQVFRRFCIGK